MTVETRFANAIRFLSMDAVEKAASGHPGMPMGMADIAAVLWYRYLRHNPDNPDWADRDRFVLSNGHGSMLLYSLLHLSGYDLPMEQLKQFRQLHSQTPGHPEYGYAPGVETTTGPLGQGLANAVGMALAEKVLGARFNTAHQCIVDHYTYVFAGDGCLMEGISHEVGSLAGTLGLNKLIAFWDDNGISIDGETRQWFTENVPQRFRAYGWNVIENVDGFDHQQIDEAIQAARHNDNGPTLICCRTVIGYGAPHKAGTAAAHGAPLGADEIAEVRRYFGWEYEPFEIPQSLYEQVDARATGAALEKEWQESLSGYIKANPGLGEAFQRALEGCLPDDWEDFKTEWLDKLLAEAPKTATRKASKAALDKLSTRWPTLFGGSADLSGSNLTSFDQASWVNSGHFDGHYLSYGVREFGMAGMLNGLSLHGGLKPYGGTFLVFSDYARNAIRMSAIMQQPVIYVMTHDSIGLGEDGPTHQPVEHLSSLRLIPNLNVWRPADAFETAVVWQEALEEKARPSLMALSRQNVPPVVTEAGMAEGVKKGGYVLRRPARPQVNLVATGAEVGLAVEAAEALAQKNIEAQVVSLPCMERFLEQENSYRQTVIPARVPALFIEAGATGLWYRLMPAYGEVLGMDCFGESAPSGELFSEFGFTVDNVVKRVQTLSGE